MQNKVLILLLIFLTLGYLPAALAEEISVVDADITWSLTLENATDIDHLIGEPGVMVVKYADAISYKPLDNPAEIGRLIGEPGVMVVKYADAISYKYMVNLDDDDWRDEWMGPNSEEGVTVTTTELQDAIHHWLEDIPVRGHIMSTGDLQEIIVAWLSD